MMEEQSIWRLLEIQPTQDVRAIKRAYARAAKQCHPEENPEQFRQLHEAYQRALTAAQQPMQQQPMQNVHPAPQPPMHEPAQRPIPQPTPQPAPQPRKHFMPHTVQAAQTAQFDFDRLIEAGLAEQHAHYCAMEKAVMDSLTALCCARRLHGDSAAWKNALQTPAFAAVRSRPEFVATLTEFLQFNDHLPAATKLVFLAVLPHRYSAAQDKGGTYTALYHILQEAQGAVQQEQDVRTRRNKRFALIARGIFVALALPRLAALASPRFAPYATPISVLLIFIFLSIIVSVRNQQRK